MIKSYWFLVSSYLCTVKKSISIMNYQEKVQALRQRHEALLQRKNQVVEGGNGIYEKYVYPILTAEHTPLEWKYDFNEKDNPFLMQRIMMNAVLNAGAIKLDGRYLLVCRVEGADRKSFFAVAESPNGIDQWRFWEEPITMPDTEDPATNIYDMRVTQHEDGWIYGHPEFVDGKYAVYTRPQDGFIDTGSGGGIGWALVDDMTHAEVKEEKIIYERKYHTITEVKNGEGPHPLKTAKGWLHLAHGVRGTADGLRYVLYMYMTSLEDPTKVIAKPGGFFLVPEGDEYIGDVMNVAFANGWIKDEDGRVLIYYASADTRLHVATSSVERLVDYCMNTPEDGLTTSASVETIKKLIAKNRNQK